MTEKELTDNSESQSREYFVHESAYVDKPCEIGSGTKIWHFCHIMKNARIGKKVIEIIKRGLANTG